MSLQMLVCPTVLKTLLKRFQKQTTQFEQSFQISIDDLPEKHNKVRKIKNLLIAV